MVQDQVFSFFKIGKNTVQSDFIVIFPYMYVVYFDQVHPFYS
jgi:hypothetical protein